MKTFIKIIAFVTYPVWIIPLLVFFVIKLIWQSFSEAWDREYFK